MYRVRLHKEQHIFSAAHFITFNGDVCERLHGHNYGVTVEVEGPLDRNEYVIDFIALRDELRTLTDELDHRMLLPLNHPLIRVTSDDREVAVEFAPDGRRWLFPRGDCVLLPVSNTTAEALAAYLGGRLLAAIQRRVGMTPSRLEIAVDENHGQWGVWEWQPGETGPPNS